MLANKSRVLAVVEVSGAIGDHEADIALNDSRRRALGRRAGARICVIGNVQRAPTSRRGRSQETLVARLERALAPWPVTVTSPDYIRGKLSDSLREVDVSVRGRLGCTNLLVIIESRERRDAEDVTWIEQLAQKMVDVGASQAVAVSSTGFTAGARNMAERVGVLLRTVEDVSPANVQHWLTLDGLTVCNGELAIDTVLVGLPPELPKLTGIAQARLDAAVGADLPILIDRTTDTLVSANDIWCATSSGEADLRADLPAGEQRRMRIRLTFSGAGSQYGIETVLGVQDIAEIVLEGMYSRTEKHVPIARFREYAGESGIAQSVEATVDVAGQTVTLTIDMADLGERRRILISATHDGTKRIGLTTRLEIEDAGVPEEAPA